jgi:hypothetical protein
LVNPQAPILAQPCGYGALAQLGERRLCKPEVAGSIPARSTELGSAQTGSMMTRTRLLRVDLCGAIRLADRSGACSANRFGLHGRACHGSAYNCDRDPGTDPENEPAHHRVCQSYATV